MDRDWLEYWQDIEDLGKKDNDDNYGTNNLEKKQNDEIQKAQELYQSVLTEEN